MKNTEKKTRTQMSKNKTGYIELKIILSKEFYEKTFEAKRKIGYTYEN